MKPTAAKYVLIASKIKERFDPISDESIDAFLGICTHKIVKNRQKVFVPQIKDSKDYFFYIIEGLVRGFQYDKDGEELNLFIKPEGTFAGSPDQLFCYTPTSTYQFESILESELLIFNLAEFENLAFENKDLYRIYLHGLKDNITTLINRVKSLTQQQPEQRYKELIEMHPVFFKKAFNKHIASYLGITPVSLSRIMKRMKEAK
ncbi:MAG: Crp/Fnr family transcriptional regulator [Spirosomaceae bacterium]|nr:Crp/Fnr family transcriptional regulator [Spirosomataceae bacterium]